MEVGLAGRVIIGHCVIDEGFEMVVAGDLADF